MNNDPISQLPEPYRTAWDILHESNSLEKVLKKTLETAKAIAHAEDGMILLKSESETSHSIPCYRVLPEMKSKHIYENDLSVLVYALANKVMSALKSELVMSTGEISSQEQQALKKEFLSGWWFKRGDKFEERVETPQSLLLIPVLADFTVAGVIVLSRPIKMEPFLASTLSDVEFFVTLVARYVCAVVAFSDSIKEKSEFVSVAAYEIKNPLTSIIGYTRELLDSGKHGPLTDIQRNFLETIHHNGKRLSRLTSNLNDLTKLEANQIKFEDKMFNVSAAILEIYEHIKSELDAKKQTVKLNLKDEIFAQGDKSRISQIAYELIRNANQFTSENGTLEISMSKNDDVIRISFTDSGMGLTDKEKKHLFEKSYRSYRDGAQVEYGNGLGLYIAKLLIEKMGGQIGAKGSPNQGSTFWFTLPLSKEQ